MIRFSCPKCQKTLQAPDDKAGINVNCPGCRNPMQVPAANEPAAANLVTPRPAAPAPAPVPPSLEAPPPPPANAQPRPLWQRAARESKEIARATFWQTIKPVGFVFMLQRRKSLRRKSEEATLALGMTMHEVGLGDKNLREKIRALGERIVNIQAVKGQTAPVEAERRGLVLKLAESALRLDKVPESIAEQHEKARERRDRLASQEELTKGAMGGLLPAGAVGWRRVFSGYGMAACIAAIVLTLHLRSVEAERVAKEKAVEIARVAKEKADQEQARVEEERKKQEAEEKKWQEKRGSADIVELCGLSVAKISYKVGKKEGGGTGFMIRPGIIATNAHVVESALADELRVYFPSATAEVKKNSYPAKVLYFDPKRDLAFLSVEPKVPPLRLAKQFAFKSGMSITVIGCPGIGEKMLENAVSVGVLSTKTDVRKQPYYQMGISVNPGNSGGPVFDEHGQVIGVVTLKSNREGISFCIPWEDLQKGIDDLEKTNLWKAVPEARSRHNLHVVMDRVAVAGTVYISFMKLYAVRIQQAQMRGRPATEGINLVKKEIGESMSVLETEMLNDKIRSICISLRTDPKLPDNVRRDFDGIWTTYTELKSQLDDPEANAKTMAEKAKKLEEQWRKNLKSLIANLGLDMEEEDEK